jgi:hypothetical protein
VLSENCYRRLEGEGSRDIWCFRLKLVGLGVAMFLLIPPLSDMLEGLKAGVCSLVDTFGFRQPIWGAGRKPGKSTQSLRRRVVV